MNDIGRMVVAQLPPENNFKKMHEHQAYVINGD